MAARYQSSLSAEDIPDITALDPRSFTRHPKCVEFARMVTLPWGFSIKLVVKPHGDAYNRWLHAESLCIVR